MDGQELVMCDEVSWEEVVAVMKYLKRGKAVGPNRIMNKILMHGCGQLVEVMF